MRLKTLYLFLLLTVVACASGGTSPSTAESGRALSSRHDRNLITADELADPNLSALSVYEAIRALRPNFLANRGTQTLAYQGNAGAVDNEAGKVHASIDGNGIIALDDLKRMHVNGIIEIRLLDPAAAMQKFGSTAKQGAVILVRTM